MTEPTPTPTPTSTAAPQVSPAVAPAGGEATIDDFKKLDLRTARVKSVDAHPNADRLYVIKLDVGGAERQVVAGIKPWYTPEQLIGKTVVVVANLKPAKLRGVESQGMILAVGGGVGLSVLTADRETPTGQRVS